MAVSGGAQFGYTEDISVLPTWRYRFNDSEWVLIAGGEDGPGASAMSISATAGGIVISHGVENVDGEDTEACYEILTIASGGMFFSGNAFDGRARSGAVLLDTDPLPGASGAMVENQPFSTTVGGYTMTYTSAGGLVVSGGDVQLQVKSDGINISGNAASVTMDGDGAIRVENMNGITLAAAGGADLVLSGYNVRLNPDDSVTINGAAVARQLVTSTDAGTSGAISVLSGGTSYVYTSALYSLAVDSVAKSTEASYLHFTLASVTAPTPVVISGVSLLNSATFEGGKEYLVGFFDGMCIVNEVTQ